MNKPFVFDYHMRHLAELENPDCEVDGAEKRTKQEDI